MKKKRKTKLPKNMNVEDLMLYDDMEQHYKKLRDAEA
jgi:hypothetical protein